MKRIHLILISLLAMACIVSCEGFETITGEQSELGEVGTTLTGTFNGASDINVSVVSLENGISTVEGTFTMTDPRYKKLIESHPKYFDVNGDKVRVHDVKFKVTTNGIENVSGESNGIIIKYDSKEGDTYSNGRKVTHVSTDNDFSWRGMKIKVIRVEGEPKKADGVKSVTYWGNHRFGIVAVETTFDDGTTDFASVVIR
ncbi:MAG: hypothetical protein IJJ72_10290 [Bacteroidales bacterium]|nr:hypothetical protein [Bacteroidales bacterium]